MYYDLHVPGEEHYLADGIWSHNTGKSLACLYRLHLTCLQVPNVRCLIARKTAVSLTSTTLVTFKNKVAKEALANGDVKWFGGSPREAAAYNYSNGSTIVVGGLDKSTRIMSSEYDLIFVDEGTELEEEDWEALGTRLRNNVLPWQQQIIACNPGPPTHWIKQREASGRMVLLTSVHEDNPTLYQGGQLTTQGAAYMAKLDALTGVRYQRLRLGRWVAAEGAIYEDWNPSVHLIDPFWPPRDWTRWWTIDFGFSNPYCHQFWAEDPDGRLYLYREIYKTQTLVEDHARRALQTVTKMNSNEWREPRPRGVICDHDAEGRATLERYLGISTIPAHKNVTDGIQAVQARLRPAGDGKPRLFIARDCVVDRDPELVDSAKPASTAEEFPGYIWAVKPGGDLKEEPLKENDHGMDACRYMVFERDRLARPRIRWFG